MSPSLDKVLRSTSSAAASWLLAATVAGIAGCGGGGSGGSGGQGEPAAGSDAADEGGRVKAAAASRIERPAAIDTRLWQVCSSEHGRCAFTGTQEVLYGTATAYVSKTFTNGVDCNNANFGDPAQGIVKSCWIRIPGTALSARDAFRLAQQATFGATEAVVSTIRTQGAASWIGAQLKLSSSRYTLGGDDTADRVAGPYLCDRPAQAGPNCWRDWFSTTPLAWDFYRNALQQGDQLRQRVAFALQQIVVVSGTEVEGTYGHRLYQNNLLDNAFGNYRQVLKKVALSPVMGEFLNNVNNDKAAPNENFGRELLQLFSLGTCLLNKDGTLQGGACTPTYSNEVVRAYAYALTGWTYPAGGAVPSWGCGGSGRNCRYLNGDMTPAAALHDANTRTLLAGVSVPANSTAPQALELVLDSLMQHPNIAPFVGRQLIQHLVSSNPSSAYVLRVAAAFSAGKYVSGAASFGTGQRGDLAATVAAVLLDSEARGDNPPRSAGKLREPVLMLTSVLRGLNGRTDGDALTWWWGETLRQHVFRAPSVFNFYPPDYPVAGTPLTGPSFALHNASTSLDRLNFLTYMVFYGGFAPTAGVPGATGTGVDLSAFTADAPDAAKLVDRLSVLATGAALPAATRSNVIAAVNTITSAWGGSWTIERVKQAAYLVYATPNFQVER